MKIFLLSVLVLSAVCGAAFASVSVSVSILISGLLVAMTAQRSTSQKYRVCFFVLLIQILFTFIIYWGELAEYGTPYYIGGSDDLAFENVSHALIQKGKYFLHQISSQDIYTASNQQAAFTNSRGFIVYLIWIQHFCNYLGGYHTLVPRLINMGLLLSTALLAEKIYTCKTGNQAIHWWFVPALALFPNAMYISAHVFRDTLSLWMIVLSFYLLIRIFNCTEDAKKRRFIWGGVLCIAAIAYFIRKENTLYILAAAVVCALSMMYNKRNGIFSSRRAFAFSIMVLLTLFCIVYHLNGFKNILRKVDSLGAYRASNSEGLSVFIFRRDLLPWGIFLRLAYALINPLPVALLSPGTWFVSINAFINCLIACGTVVQMFGYPYLLRSKGFKEVHIMFWILLLSISAVTFTFRHFILIYPFYWLLTYDGLLRTTSRAKRILYTAIMLGISLLLLVVYFLAKGSL